MSTLCATTGDAVNADTAYFPKHRPWWMDHTYHEEKQANLDGLAEFPEGSFELLESLEDRKTAKELKARVDEGEFSDLAAILFMINGHKPGPVPGFYVIVETVKGSGWCVGQLHADGATPLRVFRNPIYPSEDEARQAAQKLRLADVGNAPPRA
ncbi:hypothetical protein GGQ99_005156 [Aminobacter niigataensis]|uniref:Uncharacterized protein n=1 Tax=Aminobacter niigataensis TaxID=83265 RepID=A0ABR6L9G1_9HYPH|nr:hypothetical protein [Aminobacter niigataensis]MBB4653365.1 hypothetical protein [Aminobacter niigataensis]